MNTLKKIKNKVIQGSRERQTLLDCFYREDGAQKPVIIFCHGFKGFKDWGCFDLMAETFAQRGFVFIKFNFSYNGGTIDDPIDFPDLEAFSENNFSTELNDLGNVIELLFSGAILPLLEVNVEKISLIGHSRGGGIVVLKASEDERIYKGITLASVSDFGFFFNTDPALFQHFKKQGSIEIENSRTHQMMPIKFQFYEDFKAHEKRLNILANAQKIQQEFMIFHGTKDASVPLINAEKLYEAIPFSHLEILENAGHAFGAYQPYDKNSLPKEFLWWMDKATLFLEKEKTY